MLPLAWNDHAGGFSSSHWETCRGRLTLIPGDSPMGLRLPLSDLPWVEESLREIQVEVDPFEPHDPLPRHRDIPARLRETPEQTPTAPHWLGQARQPKQQEEKVRDFRDRVEARESKQVVTQTVREYWAVLRTCLCVEPREGRLHVFMPPLQQLEHYVQLIACIEATCVELNLPVVVEGYEPPRDARLQKLLVTPDPGVIEVNIHPAHDWRELVHTTETLYEAARKARLGTEKFMLDGRHTGTGGGNHVTMGGATPADSPFLRKPDVLRSMITFWQHHPSLSYLSSGMFIGPTSQAPPVERSAEYPHTLDLRRERP